MNLLEGLNDKQYEAVVNTEGPQNCLFNGRNRCKTLGYISNNFYK